MRSHHAWHFLNPPTISITLANDLPTRDDFLSYAALHRPLPEDAPPDMAKRWTGISMYDSEERTRAVAMRFGLGRIATARSGE